MNIQMNRDDAYDEINKMAPKKDMGSMPCKCSVQSIAEMATRFFYALCKYYLKSFR